MGRSAKLQFAKADLDLYDVLNQATKKELGMLAKIISEKTSSSIDRKERSPMRIASEIQLFGADSFVSLFRRNGVCYHEVVKDVLSRVGLNNSGGQDLVENEGRIVEKLWDNYKQTLSETERTELDLEIEKLSAEQAGKMKYALQNKQNALLTLVAAIGSYFAKRAAAGAVPMIGPIVVAVMTILSVVTVFTSPAYKVTIPCVFIVACIRARIITEEREAELDV